MATTIARRALIGGGVACAATAALPALAGERRVAGTAPPGFAGTLLLARGGRTYHQAQFGMADVEGGIPVRANTRFAFGSGSKWLTSVAVLKLVEAGRLSLETPIGRYLPELPQTTGRRVTLDHLLSNTSGIPDLLSAAIKDEPVLRTSSDNAMAMVRRFGGGDLRFAPGAGFDYAALNWVLVNAIVTRVADRPFEDAMRELVLRPLGLRSVTLASNGWDKVPNMAAAYRASEPAARKMDPVPGFVAASGNAVGTAEDAMRAAHGIFATRFLRPASLAQLVRVRWPEQEYALGGRVRVIGGQRWAWETGKVAGYRALIAQNLTRDETIVLFNNRDADQSVLASWAERIALS